VGNLGENILRMSVLIVSESSMRRWTFSTVPGCP
jgi:hypothetical protein